MSGRISLEQRARMLEYMLAHEDLARGRVSGPDAARTKRVLLEELSNILNALGSGATKTPEKWLKCWQDWKSDTKSKALKIKKKKNGTGGGPAPAPLTDLEETLLQFWGIEIVEGLAVIDPLEATILVPEYQNVAESAEVSDAPEASSQEPLPAPGPSRTGSNRARDDPLLAVLKQQAEAISDLAVGMHEIAASVSSATQALLAIAQALEQQPRIILNNN